MATRKGCRNIRELELAKENVLPKILKLLRRLEKTSKKKKLRSECVKEVW